MGSFLLFPLGASRLGSVFLKEVKGNRWLCTDGLLSSAARKGADRRNSVSEHWVLERTADGGSAAADGEAGQ